jgi:hypothetical protein
MRCMAVSVGASSNEMYYFEEMVKVDKLIKTF